MDPLSIIASTIAVVQATVATYKVIQKLRGLPKEFVEVSRRFPLAEDTLRLLRNQLEAQTVDEASKRALEPCVTACEANAKKLRDIFKSVENGGAKAKDGSVLELYRTSLLRLGKAHRIETLMNGMLRDLDALATNQLFKRSTVAQSLVAQLKEAIAQMSTIVSSVPDSDLDGSKSFNQTIESGGTGYLADTQYNNPGSGQQYVVSGSGHTMNFGLSAKDRKFRILQTLETTPYRDRKNRNPPRVPGTCEWFVNHSEFQQWQACKVSSMLWVSANPGCGKSVLARYLVDAVLQTTTSKTVCYFFFKDDFADQRSAAGALCCVLHQIFTKRGDLLSDKTAEHFESQITHLTSSFDELWDALIETSQYEDAGEIICILDAFDDFYDPENNAKKRSNLKFLVTSRPYDKIKQGFQPVNIPGLSLIHLRAESDTELSKIALEINIYIEFKVSKMQDLTFDEKKRLLQMLQTIPNRTYLWVYLALEWVKSEMMNKDRVKNITLELPKSVDLAYENILTKSSDSREARKLLHIVVAAARPLTVAEMHLALALRPPHSTVAAKEGNKHIRWDSKQEERFIAYIGNLCGLFVNVIDSKIYLLHQTAKEFLVSKSDREAHKEEDEGHPHRKQDRDNDEFVWKSSLVPAESHAILCSICIWYLRSPAVSSLALSYFANKVDQIFDIVHGHVLIGYASENWATHFRDSGLQDAATIKLAQQLCDADTSEFHTWFNIYWVSTQTAATPSFPTTLMAASFFGLEPIVKLELELDRVDINARDGIYQRSSLSWAAENGFSSVVALLIKGPKFRLKRAITNPLTILGAKVDVKDSYSRTPLSYAIFNGHLGIVKQLINAKANINIPDDLGGTPLFYALCTGNSENLDIAKEMLRNASADNVFVSKADMVQNLLLSAASKGQEKVVRVLLQTGASTEIRDGDGNTPLTLATSSGHEATVQVLLENGADIEAPGGFGLTPLTCAVYEGMDAMVLLLLDNGAEIDGKDPEKGPLPALFTAIRFRRLEMMQLLLDKGANVHVRNRGGKTPLSYALDCGYNSGVVLLLEYGEQDSGHESRE